MTDRGTRVRWTTAALVAPAAAAVFTGTTVWASAHQPATAATTTSTTAAPLPVPVKTVDPVVETLRAAVDSNSAQVLKLRAAVVSLQKQAAAIAKGANVPVVQAGTTSTWHSSSSSARKTYTSSSSSTSSGSSTKTTVSRPAPAPAPNPPVAASGGS